MRILIQNVEAATMRRDLRQLALNEAGALGRKLRWLAPRITVVLSRLDGAAGDVDKRCIVEMKSRRSGSVVVTSLARDWLTAMTSALRLARRRLAERLQGYLKAGPSTRMRRIASRRV